MSGLTFVDWYPERCLAVVYKRDCYRISRGSGGSGFRMHYTECQCERRPVAGLLVCRQHAKKHEAWGGNIATLDRLAADTGRG